MLDVLRLLALHRDAGGGVWGGAEGVIIQQSFISSLSSCSHPLDCSRPGRDRPLEQIVNYDVYCAAHSGLGGPGGKGLEGGDEGRGGGGGRVGGMWR